MLFLHLSRRTNALACLTLMILCGTFAAPILSATSPTDTLDPAFAPALDVASGSVLTVEQQTNGKVLVGGIFKSLNGHISSGVVRLNADRTVDTSFTTNVRGTVMRVIPRADGKIMVVGIFVAVNGVSRNNVARLNEDGSLDMSFNPGLGTDAIIRNAALQPDGKLIIGGDFLSVAGSFKVGVARLNSDGSLDTSFTTPVTLGTSSIVSVTGIDVQLDGKVVLGGVMSVPSGSGPQARYVLRVLADGAIDPAFSSPSISANPQKVVLQPDGKIIIAGSFTTVAGVNRTRIARLNSDGSLDTTFNPGAGSPSTILFLRLLSDGKILVGGSFNTFGGSPRGALALLNSDGSIDNSFAPSGTTSGSVRGVVKDADGRYLVGGSFSLVSGSGRNAMALMESNGSVNTEFAVTALQAAEIRSVTVQSDGKIIVAGALNRLNGNIVNSLVRMNPNGTIDPSFSPATTIVGFIQRVIFQPDGKMLLAGSGIRVNNAVASPLVRLNADGTIDSSFTLGTSNAFGGKTAAVQPDGRIVFAYETSSAEPNTSNGLVRLNPNGSVDASFTASGLDVESMALLSNGQVLVAGPFSFAYVNSGTGISEDHDGIIRLNEDGSHDRTFRSDLFSDIGRFTAVQSIYVQPDGRIVAAGRLFTSNNSPAVGIVRLNASGTLDGSFHTYPINSTIGTASIFELLRTADGKILAGGDFSSIGDSPSQNVVRLMPNGIVDPSLAAGTDRTVYSLATESNGSILLGGFFERVNGEPRTGVARLLPEATPVRRSPFDFDGDGKTDVGIYRPSGGEWWVNRSGDGQTFALQFGSSTDKIVPADYTGDGKADIAIFRPSSGEWYVLRSDDFSFFALPFGTNGDVPTPADYDADGKADFAVFRPSSSTWFISQSSGSPTRIVQFGATGDQPVVSDYDGDGKADIGIFRQAAGGAEWWIDRSTAGLLAMQFGASTDKAVQGDYTGDGKSDIAIWRPSTGEWFIVRSENLSFYGFPFGTTGDVVAPGDYDGDGKFDATVFRPSSATWFISRTTAGTQIVQFGANGDRPLPNAFVR